MTLEVYWLAILEKYPVFAPRSKTLLGLQKDKNDLIVFSLSLRYLT